MKIEKIKFQDADALELTTSKIKLIAVYQYGPRIASFGKVDGDNLFIWKPGEFFRDKWELRGGHRVWITRPGADEPEETYSVDDNPCEIEIRDNGFKITSALDPNNKTQRGFDVTVLEDGLLQVDNFVINKSDLVYSAGVWALSCSVPNDETKYVIPVGDGSSWDCFNYVHFRTWGGHGHEAGFSDTQFKIENNNLIINPSGKENKRMLQAHQGIIAMVDKQRNLTFAKKVDYNPEGKYPINCNIAAYIGPDNFMVEMETMGAEKSLKPGDSAHNLEKWILKDEVVADDKVKALF